MVTYREVFPGFKVFDCERLRASLSPTACANNWANAKCLACENCPIGQAHAGKAKSPPPSRLKAQTCIRCGMSSFKLPGGIWCLSCFNRTREVAEWRNARHGPPTKAARVLRWVDAFVHVPAATMASMRYPFNRKFKPRRPGLPNPKEYGAGGVYWVSTIMTGVEEFEAYRLRMIPYAEILELDIGRPLAELHSTTEGVARYE